MQFTLAARCFLVYSTKINCGRRSVPLAFLLHFFLKCSPTETASVRATTREGAAPVQGVEGPISP